MEPLPEALDAMSDADLKEALRNAQALFVEAPKVRRRLVLEAERRGWKPYATGLAMNADPATVRAIITAVHRPGASDAARTPTLGAPE
jgi:hypothetical protein